MNFRVGYPKAGHKLSYVFGAGFLVRSFAIWRASHPFSHPRLWPSPARAGLCWILWSSHMGGAGRDRRSAGLSLVLT